MAYDANDNKTTETSARGTESLELGDFETRYGYDDNDWPITVSSPEATEAAADRVVTTTAYNDDATKASDTNPVGAATTYEYWPDRSLKKTSAPAATSGQPGVTEFSYDLAGRLVRRVDPATNAAGTARPEVQLDYSPQGGVSVRRESSAVAGQWRTTRLAYNAQSRADGELRAPQHRQRGGPHRSAAQRLRPGDDRPAPPCRQVAGVHHGL